MNPEFQRNLWLEASPRRLAWTGVVLLLIYGAVIIATSDGPPDAARGMLAGAGAVVFALCGLIWASRATGASVLSEIAERTWDFQRLSALTPWEMTWGKLLGASSLAWLAALSGLVVLIIGSVWQGIPGVAWAVAGMIAGAFLFQGASLAAALIGVRKARAEGHVAQARGVLSGLVIGMLLLSMFASSQRFDALGGSPDLSRVFGGNDPVIWWGQSIDGHLFRVASIAAFAAWAVTGAWRLMRLELQMENSPAVWVGFLLFIGVWSAGLATDPAASWFAATAVLALAAYAAAFAEPADKVHARQFPEALARGDFARLMVRFPAALPAVVLAAICALGGGLSAPTGIGVAGALVAFMIRDLGVIAFFRFGPRPKRGDFAAVVALALFYGVGAVVGHSLGGETGGALFAISAQAPTISIVSALVQAVLIWGLAAGRIRRPEPKA